ncbi:MAG: type II toxin-antitoxin system RelE/ParE family toxin [Nitrospirae bacterium]|nr:type II toxin-antitoxin system RelE/ParE family toxin [Nitrospirota bacterium]MBI5696716.1 type II toxin-antitoxin system RelE/ParE family toxin [Nitrospirota bacterium]
MKYSFHPDARKEFIEATDYYEGCRTGLGVEFYKEVFSTIQRILHLPSAWHKFSENTRRCQTIRFPFGVVYQIMEDEVVIVAVMQLNRRPGYWKKRVKTPTAL